MRNKTKKINYDWINIAKHNTRRDGRVLQSILDQTLTNGIGLTERQLKEKKNNWLPLVVKAKERFFNEHVMLK
jgi:hypothetical protein